MSLAQYEALGRRIMAGREIPNLPPARLRTWFQQIGIAAKAEEPRTPRAPEVLKIDMWARP